MVNTYIQFIVYKYTGQIWLVTYSNSSEILETPQASVEKKLQTQF